MRRIGLIVASTLAFMAPAPAIVGDAGPVNWEIVPGTVRVRSMAGTCSGVVVASDLVLTAAHCLRTDGKVWVEGPRLILFESKIAVAHPAFAFTPLWSSENEIPWRRSVDIGLVKLAAPLLKPAVKARFNATPPAPGQPVLIVGYGRHERGSSTTEMQHRPVSPWQTDIRMALVEIKSIHKSGALRLVDEGATSGMERAGCGGDSGGPVFSIETGTPVLVAIISGGDCKGSTIVTPIAGNETWIRETAERLGSVIGE
jgi:secreted trypsin-like serine protease